jgi:hypothetical protein
MTRAARLSTSAAVLALAASLAACTSLREKLQPVAAAPLPPPVQAAPPRQVAQAAPTVRRVPVSCVPRALPSPPAYPDSDTRLKQAGEAAERYQLMAAGRLMRIRRLAELERIVAGCRRAGD